MTKALGKDTPRVTYRVDVGDASQCILEAARRADSIVMSTHGRSGLTHLLIGSVAEKVVRHATVPVLTIRVPDKAARAAARRPDRVRARSAVQLIGTADRSLLVRRRVRDRPAAGARARRRGRARRDARTARRSRASRLRDAARPARPWAPARSSSATPRSPATASARVHEFGAVTILLQTPLDLPIDALPALTSTLTGAGPLEDAARALLGGALRAHPAARSRSRG